jgi:hypothetical protein
VPVKGLFREIKMASRRTTRWNRRVSAMNRRAKKKGFPLPWRSHRKWYPPESSITVVVHIFNQDISELRLPPRVEAALRVRDINTVVDITRRGDYDIRRVPDIGVVGIKAINKALLDVGLGELQ